MQTKRVTIATAAMLSAIAPTVASAAEEQPNILWIVTDDHRADAIAAYNRATLGTSESRLGYVSSPELDKLAAEGVLFTSAYCNSPASAPSRTSMHSGMYPHHRGVYGFEYYHTAPDYTPLTMPELLAEAGYNTLAIGKLGVRIKDYIGDGKTVGRDIYGTYLNTKFHQSEGEADCWAEKIWGDGEDAGSRLVYFNEDGTQTSYYYNRDGRELTAEDIATSEKTYRDYDILLSDRGVGKQATSTTLPNTIIGGVSSNTTEYTTDGAIMREYNGYIASQGKPYNALTKERVQGPDGDQPQFHYLGHHFPHTPVLPSKSFRDKFKDKIYNAPLFDDEEYAKMPEQMKVWHSKTRVNLLNDDQKQQLIRDYYAFTAMGDSLIGVEVRKFKEFCKTNEKEYLILIVCGDHAWHLGEQGTCAKFAAYEQSNHTAVIAISSDEKKTPAGTVIDDYMEYVDILPTFLAAAGYDLKDERFDYLDGYDLMDVISGKAKKRDYTIGEIDHVCGPHGQIRTKDFMFGMRTRKDGAIPSKDPNADPNVEMRWALDAPLEDVDPILYDLRVDPTERNNVALDAQYRELAEYMRKKLGTIMLGDGRREVDWTKENSYQRSTFGIGSDDKKLKIPSKIIPKIEL
ncbi:MAG: sulfatase-like hydrolase/transferase [Rikenellaceae bacterium]